MTEKENLQRLNEADIMGRVFDHDGTVWKSDEGIVQKIENRLGWVESPVDFFEKVDEIKLFSEEVVDSGIEFVVLCGMGGSSLSPEVALHTFGSVKGYPAFFVLDNTSPDAVLEVEHQIKLEKSIFIVASKSGGTVETMSFYRYFRDRLMKEGIENPGKHFVAITDPGSSLEKEAAEKGFLETFINPPDIGGRYSVFSYFGLVPMALIGVDIETLCEYAIGMITLCHPDSDPEHNAALSLGNWMGTQAVHGKDKLTLLLDPAIQSFGYWAEQLIAESLGKEGKGITPVVQEVQQPADAYGKDRAFISIDLEGTENPYKDAFLSDLEKHEFPVYRIVLPDTLAIGGEFWCWEMATAIAGKLLEVNPFDEPNVSEAKASTNTLLDYWRQHGELTKDTPDSSTGHYDVFGHDGIVSVRELLDSVGEGDYFAQLVYFPKEEKTHHQLESIRKSILSSMKVATTLDYGPRYLHSTGQLHKGGANNGVFLMITADAKQNMPVPGTDYDFQTLHLAKALGDFQSLKNKGRRAIRLHIKGDLETALKAIAEEIG